MILGDQEKPDLTTDVSSFYSDSPLYTATHDKNGKVEGDRHRDWEFIRVGFAFFSTFHHLIPKLHPRELSNT